MRFGHRVGPRWTLERCENYAFLQLPFAKLLVDVAVASLVFPPLGGRTIRGVKFALGVRFRHTLLFRRCLVGMAPLGSSFDGLKFSIDDPAVFLESQYICRMMVADSVLCAVFRPSCIE